MGTVTKTIDKMQAIPYAYEITASNLQELQKIAKKSMFDALALAYAYGFEKGRRATKNAQRSGKNLLTTKEAAEATGRTPEQIRAQIRAGHLQARKTPAGEWIIKREALQVLAD